MALTCFRCGSPGHIAQNCAWEEEIEDPRPMWCGVCDPRTRHVDLGDKVKRCECHPESHKLPGHMRRCPLCKVVTVVWDTAGCGRHHVAGVHPEFVPRIGFIGGGDVSGGSPGGLDLPPEYPTSPDPSAAAHDRQPSHPRS